MVCRELTKVHEEIRRGSLAELAAVGRREGARRDHRGAGRRGADHRPADAGRRGRRPGGRRDAGQGRLRAGWSRPIRAHRRGVSSTTRCCVRANREPTTACGLVQAFLPFGGRVGVGGDPAADAEHRRAVGVELDGADRHVQLGARDRRRHADGAAVHPAPPRLPLRKQLTGTAFRCSGDRCGRERRGQQRRVGDSRRTVAATVDTRCHTPGAARTVSSSGTVTVPVSATRPRSLRTRSTIMMFSATSLADASSSAGGRAAAACP